MKKEINFTYLQRVFNEPKPVLPFKRFDEPTIAGSGFDKNCSLIEFSQKDLHKPLLRPKPDLYKRETYKEYLHTSPERVNNWSLGYSKDCKIKENLPKLQQFKENNFVDLKNSISNKIPRIETDHISIRPKEVSKSSNDFKGYFDMKNSYGSHFESKNSSWVPASNVKTINNLSGVSFNILNQMPISTSLNMGMMEKKIANRKKGMSEFEDITNPYSSNLDKNYSESYNKYPLIFKNYQGIFSYMYDAARRNGNLVIPFRSDPELSAKKAEESRQKSKRRFKKKEGFQEVTN